MKVELWQVQTAPPPFSRARPLLRYTHPSMQDRPTPDTHSSSSSASRLPPGAPGVMNCV